MFLSEFEKPEMLNLEEQNESSLSLSWSVPDNGSGANSLNGYVVTWILDDNGGSQVVADVSENPKTTITQLNSNTDYTIQVAVRTKEGLDQGFLTWGP